MFFSPWPLAPSPWVFLLFPALSIRPSPSLPLESLIPRLPPLKSRLQCVPVLNRRFTRPPAQQHHLVVKPKRKIQQPRFQVLHLHSNRINLRDTFPHTQHVPFEFGPLPRHLGDVHLHAAGEKNPPPQVRKIILHLLGRLLAVASALQQ